MCVRIYLYKNLIWCDLVWYAMLWYDRVLYDTVCVHVCICVYMYIYMHICLCVSNVFVYLPQSHTYMHTYLHTEKPAHIHTYGHTYIGTCTYKCWFHTFAVSFFSALTIAFKSCFSLSSVFAIHVGGCQNYGPFLGPCYITAGYILNRVHVLL